MIVIATGIQLYAMSPYQTKQAVSAIRTLLNTSLAQWDNQLVSQIDQNIRKLQPSDPAQARAFRAEFDNLKNQMQQVRAQVRQPAGVPANAQVQQQLADKDKEIAALKKQLEFERAKSKKKDEIIAEQKEKINNFNQEVASLKADRKEQREQIKQLEDQLAQTRAGAGVPADLQKRLADLEKQLRFEKLKSVEKDNIIKKLQENIKNFEQEVASLKAEREEQRKEMDKLKK